MKTAPKQTGPAGPRTPRLSGAPKPPAVRARQARYTLRLYVSRSTLKSQRAIASIKRMCMQHLDGRYTLEVIDIYQHPNLARDEQIVAVPTLIKRLPLPLQRLVGDMSDVHKVLLGLDLRTRT